MSGTGKTSVGEHLAARHGHFMPTALLNSQRSALEPPTADENAVRISADPPLDAEAGNTLSARTAMLHPP